MNVAPAQAHMPPNSRPATLAACAVLALALNAGAIGLVASWHSPLDASGSQASKPAARSTLVLIPTAADAPSTPTIVAKSSAPGAPEAPRQAKAILPVARIAPAADPAAKPEEQVLFYAFHEVDSAAFPESDWNLDVDSLDKIGVTRLAFEILVSANGDVVGCTVLTPDDLDIVVKRDLEDRLSKTRLLPAIRAGQLVASVRRIELFVAATQPALPSDAPAHRP